MGKPEPEPEPLISKHGDGSDDRGNRSSAIIVAVKKKSEKPKTWKDYFRFALPHMALVIVTSLYCIGGASIFFTIEQPHEIEVKSKAVAKVHEAQQYLMDRLWSMLQNKSTTFNEYCKNSKMSTSAEVFHSTFQKVFFLCKRIGWENGSKIIIIRGFDNGKFWYIQY